MLVTLQLLGEAQQPVAQFWKQPADDAQHSAFEQNAVAEEAAVEDEHRASTGELMKRVTSILTGLSLAVLCFVASAHAQYGEERATANIPFEFTIGNLSFPAGQYDFIRTGSGAYVVRDADGRGLLVLTAAQVQVDGLPEKSMLKFAVVNGRHVLVQIWNGYASNGNEFQHPNTLVEQSKQRSYR